MTINTLAGLLKRYCILEQIESVVINNGLMTITSSRVVDVNKNIIQYTCRILKYNEVYFQWECVATEYSDIPED